MTVGLYMGWHASQLTTPTVRIQTYAFWEVLQFLLNKRGVRVPVNAYMDKPTVAGVRRYQRQLHLKPDGVAGPKTFAALGLQTRIPVRATP